MKLLHSFFLSMILLVAVSALAAPETITVADYRGSQEVLLETPSGAVTVQDLFIYALEASSFDARRIPQWKDLPDESKERLREALLRYEMSRRFAALAPKNAGHGIKDKAARLNAAPAARVLWADQVVRDSVHVFPEDLYYAYRQQAGSLVGPTVTRARRLLIPVEQPVTTEVIEKARAKAVELRAEAIRLGGLQPILDGHPEYRLDPPGTLVEFRPGQQDVEPQILERIMQMAPAQISDPIQTRSGFFLVEVEGRTVPEPHSLPQVQKKLEGDLQARFLPQQYDYLSVSAIVRAHAANRSWLYRFLPEDADLVRVRNFAVTVGEFNHLYPEVVGSVKAPNLSAIAGQTADILTGEVVTQDLGKHGLLEDSFYQRALEMGAMLYDAGEYLRAERDAVNPTEEEVREYLQENRTEVYPLASKEVWKWEVLPRDVESMRPGELDSLQIMMRGYLTELLRRANQLLQERIAISPMAVLDPAAVVSKMQKPDDDRIRFSFRRVGLINQRQARPELGVSFSNLPVGNFTSPIVQRDGTVVSYYVSQQVDAPSPGEKVLLDLARQTMTLERAESAIKRAVESEVENGTIQFHQALAPRTAN